MRTVVLSNGSTTATESFPKQFKKAKRIWNKISNKLAHSNQVDNKLASSILKH